MDSKPLKILFLGDASNMHHTLATALRSMGHQVTLMSAGSGWMNTERDIDLSRAEGIIGTVKYVARLISLLPKMRRYDVVQLAGTTFLHLRPQKIAWVLDYLKRNNRIMVLSALGTDYAYMKACLEGKLFRYSDYVVNGEPSPYARSEESRLDHRWISPVMQKYHHHLYSKIDGAVTCLYEYHKVLEQLLPPHRLAYAGIPIDTTALSPHIVTEVPEKVKFFVGVQRRRSILKGTDIFVEALKLLCERHPEMAEMDVVENVPYAEYTQRMRSSHVILDQLYSYTPATNALIAMAQGIVAVSGAEPEFYDFIGEKELQPIINALPGNVEDVYEQLKAVAMHRHELPRLCHESRQFAIKHNDSVTVAQRYLSFWHSLL